MTHAQFKRVRQKKSAEKKKKVTTKLGFLSVSLSLSTYKQRARVRGERKLMYNSLAISGRVSYAQKGVASATLRCYSIDSSLNNWKSITEATMCARFCH